MKHARMLAPLALAAALVAPALSGAVSPADAAPKRSSQAAVPGHPAKSGRAATYRQFTGTIVALDASSLTVEKGGKTPKQMVFARHAAMRSTGDVEKDARVTVYWREEAGQPVAHRVVVKTATAEGTR